MDAAGERVAGRRRTAPRFLLLIILVLAAAAVWAGRQAWKDAAQFRGQLFEPRPAADFALLDHRGDVYRLSDDAGRVRVLFFGYTHCPDVCPETLLVFKRTRAALGDAAHEVRFLFITVDPARDTPQRMAEYIPRFDPEVVGLTGTPEAVQAVLKDYGVYAAAGPRHANGHYSVDHSSAIYLIDRAGRLRVLHAFGATAEDVAHDIRLLLRER